MKPMTIKDNTGLRKLMRAAARNRVPEERMVKIELAMDAAKRRAAVYANRRSRRS